MVQAAKHTETNTTPVTTKDAETKTYNGTFIHHSRLTRPAARGPKERILHGRREIVIFADSDTQTVSTGEAHNSEVNDAMELILDILAHQ